MRLAEDNGGRSGGGSGQDRSKLGIVIADRQPMFGAALLATHGYTVTATVHDAAGLQNVVATGGFDMVLLDIELFDPALPVHAPIVILSPQSSHPALAVASGLAGLVLKSGAADLLLLCLTRVAAGGRWFDSNALADAAVQVEANKDARQLTRRERDVARLVAAGQRNRVIATSPGISEGTVKMHLHNVYTKLGLESRTQLAKHERLRSSPWPPSGGKSVFPPSGGKSVLPPSGGGGVLLGSGGFGAAIGGYGCQRREKLVA